MARLGTMRTFSFCWTTTLAVAVSPERSRGSILPSVIWIWYVTTPDWFEPLGAMAVTTAGSARPLIESRVTETGCPTASFTMSVSSTLASTRRDCRLMMLNMTVLVPTGSPGFAPTVEMTPSMGATMVALARLRFAVSTWISLSLTLFCSRAMSRSVDPLVALA